MFTLKEAVQDYFLGFSLSESRFLELNRLQNRIGANILRIGLERKRKIASSLVAVSCMLLVLAFLSLFHKKSLQDNIIRDIISNHNRFVEMKIRSESFDIIKNHLTRLDFSPIRSVKLPDSEWAFVGGGYGVIQGKLVPIIRVRNQKTGHYFTHYQIPRVKGIPASLEVSRDGAKVKWWSENGLLMGLVEFTWENHPA